MNDRVAGVASVLPATSVARTDTLCGPSASVAIVHGLVHAAHAPVSTRHSKTALASEVNAKVGVAPSVVPVGPDVIVVSGAVVSGGGAVPTVNDCVAGVASVFRGVGRADRHGVRAIAAVRPCVHGLTQLAHGVASTRHSKTAPASEVNAKVGVVSLVVPFGPDVIVVSGAVVSGGGVVPTVNERVAGVASVLPASSVARTATVCGPLDSAAVVHGLVQSAHAPESTRHSNTAPASDVKAKVGVLSVIVPVGPEVIVVSGAVPSGGGGGVLPETRAPRSLPVARGAPARRGGGQLVAAVGRRARAADEHGRGDRGVGAAGVAGGRVQVVVEGRTCTPDPSRLKPLRSITLSLLVPVLACPPALLPRRTLTSTTVLCEKVVASWLPSWTAAE